MIITLRNPGELDLDFLKLMGVSVKESDNPIGKFGTGLKYALAVLLRKSTDFTLYIGENRFDCFTIGKEIRGKVFQVCALRGPHDTIELSFTTEFGKDWELWQAYRELRSNCKDEGGEVLLGELGGKEGYTTIVLNLPKTAAEGVFLEDRDGKLLFRHAKVEIYEGESECIYYQGIRAKILKHPSKYTYNITQRNCRLTEDRLLAYDWEIEHAINEAIVESEDAALIENIGYPDLSVE